MLGFNLEFTGGIGREGEGDERGGGDCCGLKESTLACHPMLT